MNLIIESVFGTRNGVGYIKTYRRLSARITNGREIWE